MVTAEKLKCGNCQTFDPVQVDGKTLFGTEKLGSGQEIRKGVCRTPYGLKLGILNEETSCKQELLNLSKTSSS